MEKMRCTACGEAFDTPHGARDLRYLERKADERDPAQSIVLVCDGTITWLVHRCETAATPSRGEEVRRVE
jgi:hypothetical protein